VLSALKWTMIGFCHCLLSSVIEPSYSKPAKAKLPEVPEVPPLEVPEVSPPEVPPLPLFDGFDLEQPITKPTMTIARSITGYRIKNILGRKSTSLKDDLGVPLNERQFKSMKGIAQANSTA
jgi:hypothetical protein